jgi:hypothetical protein
MSTQSNPDHLESLCGSRVSARASCAGSLGSVQMRLTAASLVLMLAASGCTAAVQTAGQSDTAFVWVCHGNRNPQWQRVAAPAADGHRRHGDRVSTRPQENGTACDNSD